jgi:hypothetical protein
MSEQKNLSELKPLKVIDEDRVIKNVPKPITKKPKAEEIFIEDKIDTSLLRKLFLGEGKLEKEHALKILRKGKEILSKEPNLLTLSDPITGLFLFFLFFKLLVIFTDNFMI